MAYKNNNLYLFIYFEKNTFKTHRKRKKKK